MLPSKIPDPRTGNGWLGSVYHLLVKRGVYWHNPASVVDVVPVAEHAVTVFEHLVEHVEVPTPFSVLGEQRT